MQMHINTSMKKKKVFRINAFTSNFKFSVSWYKCSMNLAV